MNVFPSWMRFEDSFPFSRMNTYDFLLILLKNYNYAHSEIYWYLSGCCANNSDLFFISPCNFFSNFVRTHRRESSPITTTTLVAQSCWFHLMTLWHKREKFRYFFQFFQFPQNILPVPVTSFWLQCILISIKIYYSNIKLIKTFSDYDHVSSIILRKVISARSYIYNAT